MKVDQELIQKVDDALGGIDSALAKAERENSSLYFQVRRSLVCAARSWNSMKRKETLFRSVDGAGEGWPRECGLYFRTPLHTSQSPVKLVAG